jgi:hypothetical protein
MNKNTFRGYKTPFRVYHIGGVFSTEKSLQASAHGISAFQPKAKKPALPHKKAGSTLHGIV